VKPLIGAGSIAMTVSPDGTVLYATNSDNRVSVIPWSRTATR
jgi:DNA-binding beta-propeller fold protein YncE